MSGNTSTSGHVIVRKKLFEENTVPYPDGVPLSDDDPTVVADPAEMQMTAQAMMFVDTGILIVNNDQPGDPADS